LTSTRKCDKVSAMDKDTLDSLITHFKAVLKSIQEEPEPDPEEEEFYDESFSNGYDTGLMSAIVHLELLRDGELELEV
jgi:hypothetical protein